MCVYIYAGGRGEGGGEGGGGGMNYRTQVEGDESFHSMHGLRT